MDVFISHAQTDLPLAEYLHRHLTQGGLSIYLASVSTEVSFSALLAQVFNQ